MIHLVLLNSPDAGYSDTQWRLSEWEIAAVRRMAEARRRAGRRPSLAARHGGRARAGCSPGGFSWRSGGPADSRDCAGPSVAARHARSTHPQVARRADLEGTKSPTGAPFPLISNVPEPDGSRQLNVQSHLGITRANVGARVRLDPKPIEAAVERHRTRPKPSR